ncbi:MAG: amidohydrolase family protein [Ferrimicrobium sp.]
MTTTRTPSIPTEGCTVLDDLVVAIEELPLIDNHCHSVLTRSLNQADIEDHLTESPDRLAARTSTFDSALGLTMLRWAGPLLGCTTPVDPESYINERAKWNSYELTRLFLARSNSSDLLVDSGFNQDQLMDLPTLEATTGTRVHEVLRLETTASTLLEELDAADAFLERWPALLSNSSAIGLKSVAAYRNGLGISPAPPDSNEVRRALESELRSRSQDGTIRLTHQSVIDYLLWSALIQTDLPIQFHVGLGDPDIRLISSSPAHLQPFVQAAMTHKNPIVLLHCYPYHREAALLAHDYSNVFIDIGLTLNFVGNRATSVLAETLELAPYAKVIYSSDAYGLPELFFLGARQFRHAIGSHLLELLTHDYLDIPNALRLATMIARDNARFVYQID